ncbi:MAG: SDR family oxidoreductase [Oscillospiraceae bacterium]|jgi:3-oxoacyl-[acyl-carrier protein] reductase|nr:SDR family oxidoreductase [Oscillospiraceae bacterium]
MSKYLDGKVALVTGSGQGVGRAIAKALAAEGAKVVTNNRGPVKENTTNQLSKEQLSRLSPEQLDWVKKELEYYTGDAETTAADIKAAGGEATACFGDISDFKAAKKIVDKAAETYGSLDIVINVAGEFGFAPIGKISEELWDKVNTVKPKGYFNIIHHAVPYMKKNSWGRIINCSSVAFLGGPIRHAEYCAANAGVLGLTWALACELADDGITVNAFAPNAKTRASIDMELFDQTVEKDEMSTKSGIPIVKYEVMKLPDLFAPFIVYLASDEAANVTGSVFLTAGGSISRFANPAIVANMTEPEGWTMEKIIQTAPSTLFKDYKNINQK